MDWVHCNNCYTQPGDVADKKFVITNCGHIYCTTCTALPELEQCRICQVSYRTLPLSSNMNQEIEILFHDPVEDFQKLTRTLLFQHGHRSRLTLYHRETIQLCKTLRNEVSVLKDELELFKKENASLRNENERMNIELMTYKQRIENLRKEHLPRNSSSSQVQFRCSSDMSNSPKHTVNFGLASADSGCTTLRRPPGSLRFFLSSTPKSPESDSTLFMTPMLSKKFSSYRTGRRDNTPITPISSTSSSSQGDNFCRRIKLPGDRSRSSTRTTFQRVALTRLSDSKNVGENNSKYSSYFS